MVGAAYAAVPLYQLFCQVTGYAGTPARATSAPVATADTATAPVITVYMNTDTKRGAPWRFGALEEKVALRLGEERLAFFEAENLSGDALMTQATFNVTPLKAAEYFVKIECFCFEEQTLKAGERVEMPLSFYIDPAIYDDPQTRDVKSITISYTLFGKPVEPLRTANLNLRGE